MSLGNKGSQWITALRLRMKKGNLMVPRDHKLPSMRDWKLLHRSIAVCPFQCGVYTVTLKLTA